MWKELLKLTPEGVSLRSSKFHTEECPEYGHSSHERYVPPESAWGLVWKELLKLTPEGVSLRSSKFHTEERQKCGVLPMDGMCRQEAAWS